MSYEKALPSINLFTDTEPACPADTIKYLDYCYYISSERLVFDEASHDCQMRGGDLLYVGTTEEYETVTTELEVAFQSTQEEWWFIGKFLQTPVHLYL